MEFKKKDLGSPNGFSGIIAADKSLIIYRPRLNDITGSVLSTILLQQIMYWSERNNNDFYKFTAPCTHELYKKGDSWCEELGFSKAEFSTALKKIGFKLGKNKERNLIKKEDAFIIYYTDNKRLTHYSVNWNKLNESLNEIYLVNKDYGFTKENKESAITKENRKCKVTKENKENEVTFNSETTTNITAETTTEKGSFLSSNNLDKFFLSMKNEIGEATFNTFIKPLQLKETENKITIIAPSEFIKGMLENKLLDKIQRSVKASYGIENIEILSKEE